MMRADSIVYKQRMRQRGDGVIVGGGRRDAGQDEEVRDQDIERGWAIATTRNLRMQLGGTCNGRGVRRTRGGHCRLCCLICLPGLPCTASAGPRFAGFDIHVSPTTTCTSTSSHLHIFTSTSAVILNAPYAPYAPPSHAFPRLFLLLAHVAEDDDECCKRRLRHCSATRESVGRCRYVAREGALQGFLRVWLAERDSGEELQSFALCHQGSTGCHCAGRRRNRRTRRGRMTQQEALASPFRRGRGVEVER